MLHSNDLVHVLDLCDRAVGERAERGRRFAWLLASTEPDAEPARVDAWYPDRGWAVDVRECHDDEELHRRARIVRAYGLEYAVVDTAALERDPQGRLRRTDTDAARVASQLLGHEVREGQHLEWGAPEGVYGLNVAMAAFGEDVDWDEEEDDRDEDDDEEDDDWAEEVAEQDEPVGALGAEWHGREEAGRWARGEPVDEGLGVDEILGWRGRSMAEAILGAIVLARRALSVEVLEPGRGAHGRDVLLFLALADRPGATPDGPAVEAIAAALASHPEDVELVLGRLQADGAVERIADPDGAAGWLVTPRGLGELLGWLGRASPLFGDWPPDPSG